MFTLELEELKTKAIDKLRELIAEHGVQSKHIGKMCFVIPTDILSFWLETSNMVTEITQHELISNNGYRYSFSDIPLEELLEIIDYYVELFGNDK
jgi:hypothetical protein